MWHKLSTKKRTGKSILCGQILTLLLCNTQFLCSVLSANRDGRSDPMYVFWPICHSVYVGRAGSVAVYLSALL